MANLITKQDPSSPEQWFGTAAASQCKSMKMGEFNPLRCAREADHKGDHSYYVAGQYPKVAK